MLIIERHEREDSPMLSCFAEAFVLDLEKDQPAPEEFGQELHAAGFGDEGGGVGQGGKRSHRGSPVWGEGRAAAALSIHPHVSRHPSSSGSLADRGPLTNGPPDRPRQQPHTPSTGRVTPSGGPASR